MLQFIHFLVTGASGLGASCRSWVQRARGRRGSWRVPDGRRQALTPLLQGGGGLHLPSQLPASCWLLITLFLNGSRLVSTAVAGAGSRTWMCGIRVRKAGGEQGWWSPVTGNSSVPGQGAAGV